MKYGDYEYIILLQPTSPLRTFQHIDEAVELLLRKKAENIISICETVNLKMNPFPVCVDLNGKIYKKQNSPEIGLSDNPSNGKEYRVNGAIYLSKISLLTNEMTFLHGKSYAYLMKSSESIDIDYAEDLKKCEIIINNRNSNI